MIAEGDELLLPGEVAREFGVDVRTVARWARLGLIGYIRTPGGHRRYLKSEVERIKNTKTGTGRRK